MINLWIKFIIINASYPDRIIWLNLGSYISTA